MITYALLSSYLGFETLNARSSIKKWLKLALSIIYGSPCSSHVILIKKSSRVWSWFALETLIHLGILCNFFNKSLQQLIKYFKGYFKYHNLMNIWSSMSPKSQYNGKLARWFMMVDQRNSSDQNRGPLNSISYNCYHMKMIPR